MSILTSLVSASHLLWCPTCHQWCHKKKVTVRYSQTKMICYRCWLRGFIPDEVSYRPFAA